MSAWFTRVVPQGAPKKPKVVELLAIKTAYHLAHRVVDNTSVFAYIWKYFKLSRYLIQLMSTRHTTYVHYFALLSVAVMVLSMRPAWGAQASDPRVDALIAQANVMVRQGIPPNEVEKWLLNQVRDGGHVQVQTAPPPWDAYATASWNAQTTGTSDTPAYLIATDRIAASPMQGTPDETDQHKARQLNHRTPQATGVVPAAETTP